MTTPSPLARTPRPLGTVLALVLLVPTAAALPVLDDLTEPDAEGTYTMTAPYAGGSATGAATADAMTGSMVLAAQVPDGSGTVFSSTATIVSSHVVADPVQYVHYQVDLELFGDAFASAAETPCDWGWWCYAWSDLSARVDVSLDSCATCTGHVSRTLAASGSWNVARVDGPQALTLNITLRNPTGAMLPPGTASVAVTLQGTSTPTGAGMYAGCLDYRCDVYGCLFWGYCDLPSAYAMASVVTAAANLLQVVGVESNDVSDLPDLSVVRTWITPENPEYGDYVEAWFEIQNTGGVPSGPVQLDWGGYWWYRFGWIGGLAPGQSVSVSRGLWPGPGAQSQSLLIDPQDDAIEYLETNNVALNEFSVRNCTTCADLIVESLVVKPTMPAQGQFAYAYASIKNVGNRDAGNFYARWVVDGQSQDTTWVEGIAVGASRTVLWGWYVGAARDNTIGLEADVGGWIVESDETNNAGTESFTSTPPNPPDLAVTDVFLNPPSPREGDAVTLSATITNVGPGYSSRFVAAIWVEGPQDVDGGEGLRVEELESGASVTVSRPWTAIAGDYNLTGLADWNHEVPEENESGNFGGTNNLLTVPFTVSLTPRPDLVAGDLVMAPALAREGDEVTLSLTVTNPTDAGAGNFTTRFLVDGAPVGSDVSTASVRAGGSVTVSIPWRPTQGTHLVQAVLDPDGTVLETDEDNNEGMMAANIGAPRLPDLSIGSVTSSPASPTEGDVVTFTATVRNLGEADPGAFRVRFDVDGTLVGSDVLVDGLAPQSSTTVTQTWTAVAGPHTVHAVADPANAVAESNEANNQAESTVTASPRPVRGVDLSPAQQSKTVAAKGSVTYDILVKNSGTAHDTIQLTKGANQSGWRSSLSTTSLSLEAGQSATVQLTVKAPNKGSPYSVTVTGTSAADSSRSDTSMATTSLS